MLKISLRDRISNEEVRRRSQVVDIVVEYKRRKMRWAGHVARFSDNRWTQRLSEWCPRDIKRPLGRPPRRWEDGIVAAVGKSWRRQAQDRTQWKRVVTCT